MRIYIVGCGPAGLSAYYKLKFNHDVTIIDKGDFENVDYSGLGGAGLNSDGKFSKFPAGNAIKKVKNYKSAIVLFEKITGISLGEPIDVEYDFCKRYESEYRDLEYRKKLINFLADDRSNMHFNKEFSGYKKHNGKFLIDGEFYDILIIATGKVPYANVDMHYLRTEIGCRLAHNDLIKPYNLVDPKIIINVADHEFRTFCWCNSSEVILVGSSWSGRAIDSGIKSVAINVRNAKVDIDLTPKILLYSEFKKLNSNFIALLCSGIDEIFHKLDFNCDPMVYFPTIEGYGEYPILDENLMSSEENLYIIGDGVGFGRGLVFSMLCGLSLNF